MARFSKDNQPIASKKSRKGVMNTTTLIEKMLDMKTESDGKGKRISIKQKMILAQVNKACKGDGQAFTRVMDRIDGKPVQTNVIEDNSNVLNVVRSEEKSDT